MLPMVNESMKEQPVIWDNNSVNTSTLGTFTYTGTISGYPDKVTLNLTVTSNEIYGNTPGNKSNDCLVAKYEDWIIYSNNSDDSALYKMKSDGSSKAKITDNPSSNINIYGDWIYYTSNNILRKIKVDGTYDTSIARGKLITFKNGWLYFNDDNNICKCRIDGSEKDIVTKNIIGIYEVYTDEVSFYYTSSLDYKFYKVSFDGTNKTLIYNSSCSRCNFYGDYIYCSADYYDDNYNNWAIVRIKKDGSGLTKIIDGGADTLLINGNFIYKVAPGGVVYRHNLDGTGGILLSNLYTVRLNILDDWLYFYADTENYRIKLDGTNLQTF